MKKRRLKLLCLFLTASMTAPTILQYVPGSMSLPYEVQAAGAEDAAENVQVSARDASDGIDDAWTPGSGERIRIRRGLCSGRRMAPPEVRSVQREQSRYKAGDLCEPEHL